MNQHVTSRDQAKKSDQDDRRGGGGNRGWRAIAALGGWGFETGNWRSTSPGLRRSSFAQRSGPSAGSLRAGDFRQHAGPGAGPLAQGGPKPFAEADAADCFTDVSLCGASAREVAARAASYRRCGGAAWPDPEIRRGQSGCESIPGAARAESDRLAVRAVCFSARAIVTAIGGVLTLSMIDSTIAIGRRGTGKLIRNLYKF